MMHTNNNLLSTHSNSTRFLMLLLTLVLPGVLLSACTAEEPAENEQANVPVSAPPLPDFSGVWMAIGVENPDGGSTAANYSAAGQARLDAFTAQFSEIPEAGAACVGSGMPGVMLSLVSYPIEMVQSDSRILMVAELETQVRRVFIDGRTRSDEEFPTNQGQSLGTWDGSTLVIETELFEEWPLRPWPRSEEALIVERLHLTTMDNISMRRSGFIAGVLPPLNDEVLVVDMTITDPAYYEGPQHRIAYYQRMGDEATSEYACSQGLWYDALEEFRIEQ